MNEGMKERRNEGMKYSQLLGGVVDSSVDPKKWFC
jgi:hypothetical protein